MQYIEFIKNVKAISFSNATIILPVMDETYSIDQTLQIIQNESQYEIGEIIFVVCDKTSKTSLETCQRYVTLNPSLIKMRFQKLPYLGGAIRDCFQIAQCSHVIMMASDLETDPHTVKDLISLAKQNPSAIITASRWITRGQIMGYSPFKLVLNFIFQKLFSTLYRCELTDLTYGFRIFPTYVVKSIQWEELRHPFLFETLLKPLKLKIKILETPTRWKARTEGISHNSFLLNFRYFKIGLKVLLTDQSKILGGSAP